MKFLLAILAAASVSSAALAASPPAFMEDLDKIDDVNPYVIKSIIVDGNKLIPRGQIKAVIKTKPGDFYHRKDMEEDLRAIAKLGYFDGRDLHVQAETTAAGMVITVQVKENPLFKSITFSGNHILSTARLQEYFKDQLQKPQSNTRIKGAIKAIENEYKDQGYLLAHASVAGSDGSGNMKVVVNEGIVQDIKLSGLNDDQKTVLQSALTLKAGDPYNEKLLAEELKTAYKSGKFESLERDVTPVKDQSGSYLLTIKAGAAETGAEAPAESSRPLLGGSKSKSSMPVLHRLIKSNSTIYKNLK